MKLSLALLSLVVGVSSELLRGVPPDQSSRKLAKKKDALPGPPGDAGDKPKKEKKPKKDNNGGDFISDYLAAYNIDLNNLPGFDEKDEGCSSFEDIMDHERNHLFSMMKYDCGVDRKPCPNPEHACRYFRVLGFYCDGVDEKNSGNPWNPRICVGDEEPTDGFVPPP